MTWSVAGLGVPEASRVSASVTVLFMASVAMASAAVPDVPASASPPVLSAAACPEGRASGVADGAAFPDGCAVVLSIDGLPAHPDSRSISAAPAMTV
ncbi:hypothetical protein NtRootA9_21520 [Arthrobacter sp. NtRootA9]|nr:hypothetical protein NtRootA9_21520 [Arthrobacter sp. NtRootA9]